MHFEKENGRTLHSEYYLPKVELKVYNVKIDGRNFFAQLITNAIKTYEDIRKIATGQVDDYTNVFLLHYPYFKENYKMIETDLSKEQALNADPREVQQINFTVNLDRPGNTTMLIVIEEANKTVLEFSQGIVRVL